MKKLDILAVTVEYEDKYYQLYPNELKELINNKITEMRINDILQEKICADMNTLTGEPIAVMPCFACQDYKTDTGNCGYKSKTKISPYMYQQIQMSFNVCKLQDLALEQLIKEGAFDKYKKDWGK